MEAPVQYSSEDGWCPVGTPGIVALAVMLATFMEVLDSTVVNVSLPHIAGSLAADVDQSTWVLTSYLVSNAIVLPATGWLSSLFGRKRYYMASVVIFVVSSFLCGLAPSLMWLIAFRVLQGLGGGALQPISQAVLLECYPLRQRGIGMAIFGIGVVFAPIIGPTLGGWLTDQYTWRWIFYINIPIGILALVMSHIYVVDPPYLQRGVVKMDYIGLGLLALSIGALQVVLDTGQRHDWLHTNWIAQLTLVAVVGIIVLLIWEWYSEHPIIDLRVFKIPNFASGALLIFMVGVALYSSSVLQPLFAQSLLGYTAMQSGLALSPGGLGTLVFMPVVGKLVDKWNPRYLIMGGFLLAAISLYKMSQYTLAVNFWQVAYPRIYLGVGLAFLFVPLATSSFAFVPSERTGAATGLFNLLRNIGGSFGIAAATTVLAKRAQFHQFRLVENVTPLSPGYIHWHNDAVSTLVASGQSPEAANQTVLALAYSNVQVQSSLMSFVDSFWLTAIFMLLLIPLALVLKKPPRAR